MLYDKRILTVVPARGGSKGVKLKNIQPILGIPLIGYTGKIITSIDFIDRSVVSTDNEEIAKIAESYGIDAPFRRPEELSGDIIGDWDVLYHALTTMEEIDSCVYDVIVMLQPTSPLRKVNHVVDVIKKLIKENHDSVWAVSETDAKDHPLNQFNLNSNGLLDYYDIDSAKFVARQQFKPTYQRNGVAYAITRECIQKNKDKKTLMGESTAAFIIDEYVANIDTHFDLKLAEFLLKNKESE